MVESEDDVNMRLPIVFGIILIILGILSLAVGGEALGSSRSSFFGIIVLVAGIILVLFGARVKPKPPSP